jgi:hypothetical protein
MGMPPLDFRLRRGRRRNKQNGEEKDHHAAQPKTQFSVHYATSLLFDQKTLLDVSQKELKNRFPAFLSSPGNQRQGLPTIFVADYAPSFRGTKVLFAFYEVVRVEFACRM